MKKLFGFFFTGEKYERLLKDLINSAENDQNRITQLKELSEGDHTFNQLIMSFDENVRKEAQSFLWEINTLP